MPRKKKPDRHATDSKPEKKEKKEKKASKSGEGKA